MQMEGGLSRYLVNSIEECADRVAYLLEHRDDAEELGREGKEHIRHHFLMPRLLRDELRLVKTLIEG